MAGFVESMKGCVMSVSYQERRRKKLQRYRQESMRLQEMEDDELHFEYVSLRSEYEHRKNIMTIFMLSIVIAVFMDTWKYFFSFIEKIMKYAVSGQGSEAEIAGVVFIFSASVVAVITVVVFLILAVHVKRMYELNKNLMIVEELRKEQNEP